MHRFCLSVIVGVGLMLLVRPAPAQSSSINFSRQGQVALRDRKDSTQSVASR